jgi:CheY-like chemotaxis protein
MPAPERQNPGLDQAQRLLLQLRNDFLEELPDRIDDAEPLVLALERDRHASEVFDTLYCQIHSLKGLAGTHGVPTITHICHHFEDTLTELAGQGSNTRDITDTLLSHLDLMRRASQLAGNTEDADFSSINKELEQIRQGRQKGKCVGLIVEGSAFMAHLYTNCLDDQHVEITVEADGLEALSRLLREKYDFVIMGAETKSLNGIALLYALRAASGINRNIRTIMVTSRATPRFAEGMAPDHLLRKDKDLSTQLCQAMSNIINKT